MKLEQKVVQIVIAKLKGDENRQRFIELTKEMKLWLLKQEGFISYEVYENGLDWTDRIVYKNGECADVINKLFLETRMAKEMKELVEATYSSFMGVFVDL